MNLPAKRIESTPRKLRFGPLNLMGFGRGLLRTFNDFGYVLCPGNSFSGGKKSCFLLERKKLGVPYFPILLVGSYFDMGMLGGWAPRTVFHPWLGWGFSPFISAIKVRAILEAVPFHPIRCGDEYNDHHGHMKTTYIHPSVRRSPCSKWGYGWMNLCRNLRPFFFKIYVEIKHTHHIRIYTDSVKLTASNRPWK